MFAEQSDIKHSDGDEVYGFLNNASAEKFITTISEVSSYDKTNTSPVNIS